MADSLFYQNIQNSLNTDTTAYPVYDTQTRWGLQYMVSGQLPSISPATGYEHAKTLALADAAIARQDYAAAASLTNNFTASNIVESNWQSVNNLALKLQTDTLNQSDVSTLQSIATQCYFTGGNIVWKARAMLNSYYGFPLEYHDACATNNNNGDRTTADIKPLPVTNKQSVSIYPNPNNGSFTLNYTGVGRQLNVTVCNLMGQQILSQFYSINNTGSIPVNGLNEGVYFVKVSVDGTLVKTHKIIVTK